ncbi:unnamed protein product [Larinioides sclopetarius]|uniref:Sm domain-containing protein n=1 Tax=Larinioides sclopetarius TaxID=280406 RepID=A0AAV2AA53_9ARAC
MSSSQDVSVPVSLLKEFIGGKITVDTSNGEVFTGTLIEAQDNMSMTLGNVNAVFPSGHTHQMENIYIKGHKIRYIALPPGAKESVVRLQRSLKPPMSGFRGGRPSFRGGRR